MFRPELEPYPEPQAGPLSHLSVNSLLRLADEEGWRAAASRICRYQPQTKLINDWHNQFHPANRPSLSKGNRCRSRFWEILESARTTKFFRTETCLSWGTRSNSHHLTATTLSLLSRDPARE